MPNDPDELRGLNILSFDGGGITGLSSLYIVREIMDRLQAHAKLPTRPEPWEYFDLIGGTGTGAVSAIMLGRLRLSLNDTIKLYHQLMIDVFSAKKRVALGSGFKATNLEAGLKKIILDATGDADEMLMEEKPQDANVVYAMSFHNLNASLPCAFRTYPASTNVLPDCPIWKALRASMAHPELFKSVEIDEEGLRHRFIGGALGCNNPTAELLKETSTLFPTRLVSTITSVGAGHAKTIRLPEPSRFEGVFPIGESLALRLLRAARRIAEDTEKVAEDLAIRFSRTSNIYFRLNVDQGMQSIDSSDWEKQSAVASHTRAYLRLTEVSKCLYELVKGAQARRPILWTTQIDGCIDIPPQDDPAALAESKDGCTLATSSSASIKLKHCPRPTFMFKGRKLQLKKAENYFANENEQRHVFVFHGLGGAGKTQTALKCAELMSHRFEGILFVDGSSRSNIEAALSQFAETKHIGKEYTDALQWFEQRRARWLILIDNVDDPSVRVHDYFPRVDKCDILITTRHKTVVCQARGRDSDCKIDEMNPEEAMELLFEAARLREDTVGPEELRAAASLLQEFGHLALAIVQCGAFISRVQCTISQYYEMFIRERRETLEGDGMKGPWLDDYQHSVFTTWTLNKLLVGTAAEKLWNLFVPMHRNKISETIFRRAYENLKYYKPIVPVTESELKSQQEVTDVLELFAKDEKWNSRRFFVAMGELACLSMIDLDPTSNMYRLHPLVQEWARSILPHDGVRANTAFLLSLSLSSPSGTEDYSYRRAILSHVAEIQDTCRTQSPNDAWNFAAVYRTTGNFAKCEPLERFVAERRADKLGDDHPSTLESVRFLATTQRKLGRLREAETMLVKLVATQKKVLGDGDPSLLSSIAALAATYYDRGRWADAELLEVEVLDARKRVLGHDHPDTLWSMASLALTYSNRGRLVDAESLGVEVLAARRRVLGHDHPNTLSSMANLAAMYYRQGRLADAESLGAEVLAARKRVLGDDHPDTLSSIGNLALTYSTQGRLADAESLEVEVLAARRQALGEDHPDTLWSMANLALTYYRQGRLADAESLGSEMLTAYKRVLGHDHPDTLWSMENLALTYYRQGRLADAESLEVEVLAARKRVLGHDHPDTLWSMASLVSMYSSQGRLADAESLGVEVLAARRRVLGHDHPKTLWSMANLALTYYRQGRLMDAELLEVEVLASRKRVLGHDHPDTLLSMGNLASTYSGQGRLADAESLGAEVLATRKRVLGHDHPDTLWSMGDLASIFSSQGRLGDAEALEVEVLATRKRVLGDDHPDTLLIMGNLALTYSGQGRLADAESLGIEVLAARKRVLGHNHPDTLWSMANLASTYYRQGRLADAESLEVEVLAARKRVLGEDHPDTVQSIQNLSLTYKKQSRYDEPKTLPEEAETMDRARGTVSRSNLGTSRSG